MVGMIFGQGIKVSIIHRPGKQNIAADALSCSPCGTPAVEGIGQDEVQVATVISGVLLTLCNNVNLQELYTEQRKDPSVVKKLDYLEKNRLPLVE